MDKPQAPNPLMSSMLQSQFNTQAAATQQRMNMMNQKTPWGSLNYSADANSPSGYTATQEYSPEVQALINSNLRNSQGVSDTESALLANAKDAMSKPLDLSWGATEAAIDRLNKNTLDPQWQQNQNTFDQQMANKGLVAGSAAYDAAARNFGQQRDNAYNSMYLQGHQTAVNDITNQYNSPFNAIAALRSGSQMPTQPSMGFTTTPQESIQAPNFQGAEQNAYQQQMQQYNSGMGGLFGMGGSILSGAMKYGLPYLKGANGYDPTYGWDDPNDDGGYV